MTASYRASINSYALTSMHLRRFAGGVLRPCVKNFGDLQLISSTVPDPVGDRLLTDCAGFFRPVRWHRRVQLLDSGAIEPHRRRPADQAGCRPDPHQPRMWLSKV